MFDTALDTLVKAQEMFAYMMLRIMVDYVCVSTGPLGFVRISVFSLLCSLTEGQFGGQLTAYQPILVMRCVYTGIRSVSLKCSSEITPSFMYFYILENP